MTLIASHFSFILAFELKHQTPFNDSACLLKYM